MTARSRLDEKLDDPAHFRAFYEEAAVLYVTEKICEVMEEKGVSREELAKRLGMKKGSLTRILRGTSTPTLRQIGAIACVLGCDLNITFRGRRER